MLRVQDSCMRLISLYTKRKLSRSWSCRAVGETTRLGMRKRAELATDLLTMIFQRFKIPRTHQLGFTIIPSGNRHVRHGRIQKHKDRRRQDITHSNSTMYCLVSVGVAHQSGSICFDWASTIVGWARSASTNCCASKRRLICEQRGTGPILMSSIECHHNLVSYIRIW